MANVTLLLFSTLVLCLALFYLRWRWPDLDVVDVYIIFIALYYGVYPFIRGLYYEKGIVYNPYNADILLISLLFLQVAVIIAIIRLVSLYLPERITRYLKLEMLTEQWGKVNNLFLMLVYAIAVTFPFISYYLYGVKSHISPADFARMGQELPYWLTSIRTIYGYLALGVVIALVSKASRSDSKNCYVWLTLLLLFLPFSAYYGRKGFVNILVVGMLVWMLKKETEIFRVKNFMVAGLLFVSFVVVSNIYQTYRKNLQTAGVGLQGQANPLAAALNFKATLHNLGIRPGTWEFNYLVLDGQINEGKPETHGEISKEGFKSAIPRILWPGKNFKVPAEILADLYGMTLQEINDKMNVATNIFGVAQMEFGFLSIIIVPVVILLIIVLMAGVMKITFNYPVFVWIFSVIFFTFFMNIEETQNELFFMLRYVVAVLAAFLCYLLAGRLLTAWKARSAAA